MNIESELKLIEELDLEPIKVKLIHPKEGPKWTLEQADRAEIAYKRFLALNLKYPNRAHVPSHEMDVFWHYHILDTAKYAEDCELIFGRFLHHFPYFGLRGNDDANSLRKAYEETKIRYAEEFGDPMVPAIQFGNDAEPDVCGPDPDSCAPEPSCESALPYRDRIRPRPIRVNAMAAARND
jgi:hypothetical protein